MALNMRSLKEFRQTLRAEGGTLLEMDGQADRKCI
jgi:hypothetical protein